MITLLEKTKLARPNMLMVAGKAMTTIVTRMILMRAVMKGRKAREMTNRRQRG